MPNVLLSTNTVGAEIRYSTDGNDVTEESTLYSGQFSVEAGVTVKAKAFKTGMNPSPQSTLQSFAKLQTPTVSLSRNGSVITITLGNTAEGATYRYKVGSAPTSSTDGTAISGSATLDNSSALTIYVVGWMTGTYNPSDTAMDSVEQYVPTLQTPTFSLSRNKSTVNGTIGNIVSGATYVYKVGSAPSSQSDGTVISGTTFSFNNNSAVTVYVRGFMSGYNPSSSVSRSVSAYIPYAPQGSKLPTPVVIQSFQGDDVVYTITNDYSSYEDNPSANIAFEANYSEGYNDFNYPSDTVPESYVNEYADFRVRDLSGYYKSSNGRRLYLNGSEVEVIRYENPIITLQSVNKSSGTFTFIFSNKNIYPTGSDFYISLRATRGGEIFGDFSYPLSDMGSSTTVTISSNDIKEFSWQSSEEVRLIVQLDNGSNGSNYWMSSEETKSNTIIVN